MTNQEKRWELLSKEKVKTEKEIIQALLKNRGIREKEEFFNPVDPVKISLKSLGIKQLEVKKAIARIKKAKKTGEKVIVYGDYDADGIDGTAILWEALHSLGLNVLPYIPERFSEGYGLNIESIKKLKEKDPDLSLIITVDHGIVAGTKIDTARELGIDVIITDHHQKGKVAPKAFAIIYTDKMSGAGVSWIFAREVRKKFKIGNIENGLELAAIGTIADQLPLLGPNRSIVKFGLHKLNETKRPGLLELFRQSRIEKGSIGVYEVGFIIAPRINAMGRLEHAIDSLRLLCTGDLIKAGRIARHIGAINSRRQKIVDEAVVTALSEMQVESKGYTNKIIVSANESYHEGVIGLIAGKLVEEFYRPAIVLSKKGKISKASARSISGFNIIEAIRQLEDLYIEGGGHPMAAGFSIKTSKIGEFTKRINKIAKGLLTEEILSRKLKIDVSLMFDQLNYQLLERIAGFEPTGLGNPTPTFTTRSVEVIDKRTVGRESKHLKLKLKQNEYIFDSIYFGGGEIYSKLTPEVKVDIAFQLEDNSWNGRRNLQLKIKDLRLLS